VLIAMTTIRKMSAHQKIDKLKGKPFALDSAAVLRKLATNRAEAKEVRDGIRPHKMKRATAGTIPTWPNPAYTDDWMMTIRFESGVQRRIKADSAAVKDGILEVYVYTKDRSQLQRTVTVPAKTVRWALLDNGTYVIGDSEVRYD
jgi:hypothetical protein